jgi:signal transduction histidine kinase
MSLRAKFLALFAVFAVIPLISIGIFDYVYSLRALEALIATEVGEIATRAAEQLEQSYALRESDLLLLAENTETQELYQALGSGDARAQDAAFAAADAYLRQAWSVVGPGYGYIEFRDVNGAPVYFLPPNSDDESSPFGDAPASYPTKLLTVVRSIRDATAGEVTGSLTAAIDLERLLPHEQLAQKFGATGYSTVVDRERQIVLYHPSHTYRDQSLAILLGPEGWKVDPAVIERERGTFTYRERDTLRVAAFASLADPPVTIVASGSLNEFSAPFTQMRARNLLVVLVVAAAVAAAFTLMTRRETRSLLALTAAADQVGAGNFTPELPEPASGEVGRLSAAFDLMVAKVRETLKQVEASRHMAVVGEFASQVSHEIRNPLTSLKLNLQSLERDARSGTIPGEWTRPIEISLREIERLERVVSGVLSLGRPRSTTREPHSVRDLLSDALEVVEAQLNEQGVRVETDYTDEADIVDGDGGELKAAFLNLFLNAAEAMPSGGTLSVSTRRSPPAQVEVRVSDEGPGISGEARDEIFRPFYSTKDKGTGLGLSLALRTVEEHGGRMTVAERPRSGRGAEFVVTLPLPSGGIGA